MMEFALTAGAINLKQTRMMVNNDEAESNLIVLIDRCRPGCARLLGREIDDALTTQAARVLAYEYASHHCQLSTLDNADEAYAAFARRRLLPKYPLKDESSENLYRDIMSLGVSGDARSMAAAFAACVYPQWANRMDAVCRRRRCKLFVSFLKCYGRDRKVRPALERHLSEFLIGNLAADLVDCLDELLADLGGVARAADDTSLPYYDETDRLTGATLFLCTCTAVELQTIHANWLGEKSLLRFVRSYCTTLPGDMRFAHSLTAQLGPEDHRRLFDLDRYARTNAGKRWPRGSNTDDRLQSAWEEMHAGLTSGFPHYAFLGKLASLVTVKIGYHRLTEPRPVRPRDLTGIGGDDEEQHAVTFAADHDFLRAGRACFRLVRITFLGQDRQGCLTNRLAIDELWEGFLRETMREGGKRHGCQKHLSETVSGRYHIKSKRIESMFLRMKKRMKACVGAWLWRASNAKLHTLISSESRKSGYTKGKASAKEPGIDVVAALAKTVTSEGCLLGPLLAYLLLRPPFNAKYSNDWWSSEDIVRELWVWINEPGFEEQLRVGAQGGSNSDRLVLELVTGPLSEVTAKLQAIDNAQDLEVYLDNTDFGQPREAAIGIIERHLADTGYSLSLCQYLPEMARRAIPWVVPVWYLLAVERLNEVEILERLAVDEEDQPVVCSLTEQIMDLRSKQEQTGESYEQI